MGPSNQLFPTSSTIASASSKAASFCSATAHVQTTILIFVRAPQRIFGQKFHQVSIHMDWTMYLHDLKEFDRALSGHHWSIPMLFYILMQQVWASDKEHTLRYTLTTSQVPTQRLGRHVIYLC